MKILSRDDEDNSRTAGLATRITVKMGSKVMFRRNIDVTLGLVNGTIGTIISITRSFDTNDVEKIKIRLKTGFEYEIKRVRVKFTLMDGVYVVRKQFPLCLSYGITLHKSQGLSLDHVAIDAGNSIFTCGQTYVGLSRVTTLDGLHLINFDPHSVKADELAIIEYNRLRQKFRSDLGPIKYVKQRARKVSDFIWAIPKNVVECQIATNQMKNISAWSINGLTNVDGVSCYANAIIQCIFNCQPIREQLFNITKEKENPLTLLLRAYVERNNLLNSVAVREYVGGSFSEKKHHDVSEFFIGICNKSDIVKNVVEHKLTIKTRCKACQCTTTDEQPNNILVLTVPRIKKALNLQDIIEHSLSQWHSIEGQCNSCGGIGTLLTKTSMSAVKQVLILKLLVMSVNKESLKLSKNNFSIKGVPSAVVTVCGKKYKVNSAIFHHGRTIFEGHYTSMLRAGPSWICVNDSKVEKKSWPRNAKNSYVYFLEQTKK